MVRTRATGTPDRSAARSLSPTAMNCLPRSARMSSTDPTPTARNTTTDHGSCSSHGHVVDPAPAERAEPLGQAALGAPSVQ